MGKLTVFATNGFQIAMYIVIFLLALAVLITIHELGHLIAAKSFKVYCTDFSIGFGPKIVKIKRENAETRFSIGAFPFGGYVAMVADVDDENLEGLEIPKERTMAGIKRWKRIIIMLAGVTMNFILAYFLFLISVSCFPQLKLQSFASVNEEVAQNYFISDTKFQNNDGFLFDEVYLKDDHFERFTENTKTDSKTYWVLSKTPIINSNPEDTNKYIAVVDQYLAKGVKDLDFANHIDLYVANETPITGEIYETLYVPTLVDGKLKKYELRNDDKFEINLYWRRANDHDIKFNGENKITYEKTEDGKYVKYNGTLKLEVKDAKFSSTGLSFYKFDYWYGWKSFEVAGQYWVENSQFIGKTIGSLFVGKNWDAVGGPIAMYTQTTQILEQSPFYMYIMIWGIVSINLGIVNLIPFPGLDGYQVLVEIIEGSVNGIMSIKRKNKIKKDKKEKDLKVEEIHEDEVSATKDVVVNLGENEEVKEWKIPTKVKTIVSLVGVGLLLTLSLVLVIKDIFGLF